MRASFLTIIMLLHTGLAAWCCCMPLVSEEQVIAESSSCCSLKQVETIGDHVAKDCRCSEEVQPENLLPIQEQHDPKPVLLANRLQSQEWVDANPSAHLIATSAPRPPPLTPITYRNRILRI